MKLEVYFFNKSKTWCIIEKDFSLTSSICLTAKQLHILVCGSTASLWSSVLITLATMADVLCAYLCHMYNLYIPLGHKTKLLSFICGLFILSQAYHLSDIYSLGWNPKEVGENIYVIYGTPHCNFIKPIVTDFFASFSFLFY